MTYRFTQKLRKHQCPIRYCYLLTNPRKQLTNTLQIVKSTSSKNYSKDLGVCAVQLMNNHTIEIKNLAILSLYRNLGIGRWCLQQIEAKYKGKDILVGTGDSSLNALRFYENNGFTKFDIRKNFYLKNYQHPIIENGIQLKDQIVLRKSANS